MANTLAQIGDVEDVISEIIGLLPKGSQAAAARVSSKWNEIALPKLWRDLDSVVSLLELLAPIERDESVSNSRAMFTHSLRDANWDRFHARAQLVKSLKWDDTDAPGILANEIFAQVLFHRPSVGYFLPNLETLTWAATVEATALQLLPMVNPSLKTLKLTFHDGCEATAGLILESLVARGVGLLQLEISTSFHISDISDAVASFFDCQPQLMRLGLPNYYTIDTIVVALGRLRSLREIYLTTWGDELAGIGLDLSFDEGAFESLESIGWIDTHLWSAAERLQGHIPSRLTQIHLSTYADHADNPGLTNFISALVDAIPRLESLSLCHFTNSRDFIEAKSFRSIESLLKCKGLMSLQILDNEPVVVVEEDVIRMAQAWPHLHRLHLTPEPIDPLAPDVGAPITLLSVFAQFFTSKLEHLGIYIRPATNVALSHAGVAILPRLRTLAVGTSPVRDVDKSAYAAFLAGICPPGIVIQSGRHHLSKIFTDGRYEDSREERAAAENTWGQIREQVREIHNFQRPMRYQLEMVRMENACLRLR
ncbi:hypothetical protein FRB97_009152 [Tulasnella sp. 331]|nr:hypothetical protein FRB97_009152 [Tulasnella sp. 331]KAG8874075.1 hypothetical protein FRB98_008660 [Tulasnella sp. 332]